MSESFGSFFVFLKKLGRDEEAFFTNELVANILSCTVLYARLKRLILYVNEDAFEKIKTGSSGALKRLTLRGGLV